MSKTLKTKPRIISLTTAVVGLAVVVLAVIAGWVAVPKFIEKKVKDETQIEESSYIWDKWVDIPVPIYLKVWFFNVTNPEVFQEGPFDQMDWSQKPILKEVGPYVFQEKRVKYGIRDGPDDSIYFRQNVTYIFSPEQSGPGLSEDDPLTLLNAALIAGVTLLDVNPIIHPFASAALESLLTSPNNAGMFVTKYRVADILFRGHKLEPIYQTVEILARILQIPIPNELSNGQVAFYRGKNGTNGEGEWSVYRGRDNHEKFNIIRTINDGKKDLTPWWEGQCAKVNGTDGIMFPPFLKKDKRLYVYRPEACRSIYVEYDTEVKWEGIDAYRYKVPKSLFEGPHVNPDNHCFWRDVWPPLNNTKEYSGISRMFSCKDNVPLFMSKPHFLDAEKSLLDKVKEEYDMKPNRDKHDSFLDLEPNTGFPLRAQIRLQLGLETQRFHTLDMKPFNTIPHSFFPVVWVEMKAELNEELIEEVKSKLVRPLNAVKIVKWTLIGVGTFMLVTGSGFFSYNWFKG